MASDARDGDATSPNFRLLRLTFAFRGPRPLIEQLASLFAGLETSTPATIMYETERGADGYLVRAGDDVLARLPSPAGVGDTLLWAVNRDVIAAAPSNLLLHAAAIERDGVALVLVGPPGSGKSTLTAGLVSGGWRYLTDEAVLLDPATRGVVPYPKPITLKAGSWPTLPHLEPDLDERAAPYFVGAWFVRPDAPAAAVIPVRAVVALAPPADNGPSLTPLGAGAGLLALADQCFRFHDGPQDQIASMDRLVRAASCWRLSHGQLADDIAVLNDLWKAPASAAPRHPFRSAVMATSGQAPAEQLAADVAHLVYAEDSVLVSADGLTLHGLDAASTAILLAVLAGATKAQVAGHLAGLAGTAAAQVEADVSELLQTLRRAELLTPAASN